MSRDVPRCPELGWVGDSWGRTRTYTYPAVSSISGLRKWVAYEYIWWLLMNRIAIEKSVRISAPAQLSFRLTQFSFNSALAQLDPRLPQPCHAVSSPNSALFFFLKSPQLIHSPILSQLSPFPTQPFPNSALSQLSPFPTRLFPILLNSALPNSASSQLSILLTRPFPT